MPKQRVLLSDLCKFHTVPQQLHAYDLTRTKKFILYGGAAGGGKSRWLRWSLVLLLMRFFKEYQARNVNVGLFCENYGLMNLHRRTVVPLEEMPEEYRVAAMRAAHDERESRERIFGAAESEGSVDEFDHLS